MELQGSMVIKKCIQLCEFVIKYNQLSFTAKILKSTKLVLLNDKRFRNIFHTCHFSLSVVTAIPAEHIGINTQHKACT